MIDVMEHKNQLKRKICNLLLKKNQHVPSPQVMVNQNKVINKADIDVINNADIDKADIDVINKRKLKIQIQIQIHIVSSNTSFWVRLK